MECTTLDQAQRNAPDVLPGLEALAEACARNAPLEIVQADLVGVEPFARGRMLEIESGALMIEQVQVIGKNSRFSKESRIKAYFRFHRTLYEFRSVVLTAAKAIRLNRSWVVPAIDLQFPTEVEIGQRRNVYRVSLAVLERPVRVEVWHERPPRDFLLQSGVPRVIEGVATPERGGIDEQGEVFPPTRQPDWTGTMIDASDVGIGVNLESCRSSELKIFDRGWIRFELPDDAAGSIVFEFETRQVRPVRERVQRIGMMILEHGDRWKHGAKVRRLWRFLTECQRRICR
ncbi:MAG TPA: hypothetical protein ENJ00_07045 [Phycisphaerales bacterium]|nr:hypothetical protein [Phycisphaerales bacterium]